MNQQLPVAQFYLFTNNSYASLTKSFNCDDYYYNVNMREILGDLYDQYEYFSIQLTQIQRQSTLSGDYINTVDINQRINNYFLSGLDFISYNASMKNNQGSHLCCMNQIQILQQISPNAISIFRKPIGNVVLNLKIQTLNNIPPNITQSAPYNNLILIFLIYPVHTCENII